MATYTVVFRADRSGYDIHVKDDSGGRHTILGFETEEAAKAWIAEDQRLTAASRPESERVIPRSAC
jgi:hypothetical protein